MRYFKDSVAGKTSQPFPEAYSVLDDAWGVDAWRPRSGKGCSFVFDHSTAMRRSSGARERTKSARSCTQVEDNRRM